MKVCQKCNAQMADTAKFCTVCGWQAAESAPASVPFQAAPPQPQAEQFQPSGYDRPLQVAPTDNRKTYSILAYIGIFWLFGMLAAPEKFDRRVRFHVGQGIMASIVSAACCIVAAILSAIFNSLFTTETTIFGYGTGYYETSPVAEAISTLLWLAAAGITVFFAVYGIIKIRHNEDGYLPLIGKFAFYK